MALALAAGASAAGSWVGVVGVPSLGLAAAAELGVALERLVLVAPPAPGEWATVAATLVDAFDVVLAAPPRRGGLALARRLQARVRERGAVLCTVRASGGTEPDLTLATTVVTWEGLEPGAGCLRARQVTVQATGRRAAARPRQATLWLPDASGQVRLEEPAALDLGRVVPLHPSRLVARSVERGGVMARRSSERVASERVASERVARLAVVWCPEWPVVAAGAKPGEPAAVLHANRVLAASPAAMTEGVRIGQRRREAQATCPGLVVLDHDPARDARAFEPLLQALEQVTPWLEVARPGACVFGTRGPSRYHGGDEALTAKVAEVVAEVLGPAKVAVAGAPGVGVADGRFTAEVAARRAALEGAPHVVPRGASAPFLAPLTITTLELVESLGARAGEPGFCDLLSRLGLRTLGALAALPARHVLDRFGPLGRLAHRLASGGDERPPSTRRPPPELAVQAELEPAVTNVEPVAFVAKQLADGLHASLAADGLVCTRVVVLVETEHGERQERVWRHEPGLHRAGHRRAGPLAAGGVGRRPGPSDRWHQPRAPGARRGGARPRPPARLLGRQHPGRRAGGARRGPPERPGGAGRGGGARVAGRSGAGGAAGAGAGGHGGAGRARRRHPPGPSPSRRRAMARSPAHAVAGHGPGGPGGGDRGRPGRVAGHGQRPGCGGPAPRHVERRGRPAPGGGGLGRAVAGRGAVVGSPRTSPPGPLPAGHRGRPGPPGLPRGRPVVGRGHLRLSSPTAI